MRYIKNWILYLRLYFHAIKSEYAILEMRNGIKIKLRTKSTDFMAFTNVWLINEYCRTGFEIGDSDTVIDIGAHIGLFALYSSQFCNSGKIYCFEPVRENFELLKANIELNHKRNIVPINAAVSENDKNIVTIYLNEDEAGHSMHIRSSRPRQVKSISLQNIFDNYNIKNCNFLKIDCEGEEFAIINSLSTQYFDKINKICMEYHLLEDDQQLLNELIGRLKNFYSKIEKKTYSIHMGIIYALK